MRLRPFIILILLFGGAILILAYSGVSSSKQNMLKLLVSEGESLMQSLIISAQNNVAASAIAEQATTDRIVDLAATLGELIDESPAHIDSLAVYERRYRLERIDIVDSSRQIIASSWPETIGDRILPDDERGVAVDSVISGQTNLAVCMPPISVLPRDEYVKVAVATDAGVIVLHALTGKLTDFQESLGIGFLVRQLGSQQGVDYVVLQAEEGIVLASRDIGWMVAIEADTFLTNAVVHGAIAHRIREFEGREILEVVRAFRSDALPSALFRLGMSMESYHRLAADSVKQLVILSAVLFVLGIVGSYAVVSGRRLRRTAVDLERLQSLTNEIIDSVEAAVVATNRSGTVTIFNPEAEQIYSRSARAAIGKPYRDLFPEDELGLERVRIDTAAVVRGEIRLRRDGGGVLHLLVSASPIQTADGAFAGAVSIAYDLTEIKRLEQSARASERLSELGNLAAGVAHEIRNPLNSISMAAQRLKTEFSPSEHRDEYDDFLTTITAEIERLNSIIKDFLALARGGKLDKVLVDLKEYLRDIVSLVSLEAESRRVHLTYEVEPGLKANLDRDEMKKVIVNLLKNGIEAAPPEGRVTMTARAADSGQAQIEISNSGESIPEEIRQRIFQPYFTTKTEGTGLGLAICHRIVADHGGRLELVADQPTTFRVVI
jgi:PAS domain S-box-containing protein